MAINFPSNPSVNQTLNIGSNTWVWDGIAWNIQPPGSALDDLSNVNVTGALDGQVLAYNSSLSAWVGISLASTFNGGAISNALQILSDATSPNVNTGALVVTGGVGIGGALNVGGNGVFSGSLSGTGLTASSAGANITGNSQITGSLTVSTTGSFGTTLTVRSAGEFRLNDTDNTNYISLKAPANLTANTVYQLPGSDGTSGFVLSTNGAGALSWIAMSGGGGGGGSTNPPGGVTGNIQYNNNGTFGGTSAFSYDILSDTVTLFNLEFTGSIDAADNGNIINLSSLNFTGSANQIESITIDTSLAGNSNSAVPTESAVKTYVDDGLGAKADLNGPTFTGTVNGISKSMVGLGNVENVALTTWTGNTAITSVGTLTNLAVAGNISSATKPTLPNHITNKNYVDTRAIAMGIALS
jgi:hypothetical protein